MSSDAAVTTTTTTSTTSKEEKKKASVRTRLREFVDDYISHYIKAFQTISRKLQINHL